MKKIYYTAMLSFFMLATHVKAISFTNNTSITLIDDAPASLYPSPIVVSGLNGTVSSVTVTIQGLSHNYVSDVSFLLQAPSGESLLLQSFCADGATASNLTYTISDAGAAQFSNSSIWNNNGTYKPTSYMWDIWPSPAPLTPPGAGTYNAPGPFGPQTATFASTFNGISPNGTWKLFAADFASGDAGVISGGWSLNISTGVALPLSKISLNTVKQNNISHLRWSVQDASNIKSFNIEHSLNGKEFVSLKEISAIDYVNSYSYQHYMNDNTVNYYRIKAIGLDNEIGYSTISSLSYLVNAKSAVYPTVTKDYINVHCGTAGVNTVTLVNIFGQPMLRTTSDQEDILIKLENVLQVPGTYFVILDEEESGRETFSIEFQK